MSVAIEFTNEIPIVTYTKSELQIPTPPLRPQKTSGFSYIDWSKSPQGVKSTNLFLSISAKWLVIIILSFVIGYITTFISLSSVWMNDLKKGFCFSRLDKWSLLDPYSTCPAEDWHTWSYMLFGSTGVTSNVLVNLPIYSIFAIAFTLVACYVTLKAPDIVYSGIPEIKLIVSGLDFNTSSYLGMRTLLYKVVGLIFVVSSGFWLGKEGPLIHLSCCILNITFNLVYGEDVGDPFLRRELLGAATATGIAVAFNSPIGGVLFTLELFQTYFTPTKSMWNSFISATIAVLVVTGFKVFTNGADFVEKDLFQVEFGNFSWLFMEFIPFTILGVLGGLYGYIFSLLNSVYSIDGWRSKVQKWGCNRLNLPYHTYGKPLEVMAVLVITIILNFPFEITRLPLEAYLKILFTDCPETDDMSDIAAGGGIGFICNASNAATSLKLLYILVQGFLLASYTFGLNLPGGVLMPSLALGATTGRLIGIISQEIQNRLVSGFSELCTKSSCLVSPSSYAVVGAAAFLSGITKLTMCVVVIIFEQTGAVSYVLPIMISVMVLKFVNDYLCNDNIYDQWLKKQFNTKKIHETQQRETISNGSADYVTNSGKGSGLCQYENATSKVKNNLPDVVTLTVMIPTANIKCMEIVKSYTVAEIDEDFFKGNNHEGFPVIGSYSNPVFVGYITKESLRERMSSQFSGDQVIKFSLSNSKALPRSILSEQLRIEQMEEATDQITIPIEVEVPTIVINQRTPIVTLLEMFEKLHLNYSVILRQGESDQLMDGLVDRYLLADQINSGFVRLKDEPTVGGSANDFDV